jgi:hypothetical protein
MTRPPRLLAGVAGIALGACCLTAALHESGCSWIVRTAARDDADVRPPAVAGKFYPADPAKLRRAVTTLVSGARPAVADDVVAVVAPHAGYVFSGQIAADALAYVKAVDPDVVVVLGANHAAPVVRGFAVYPGRAFRTPLGEIAVDRDITTALIGEGGGVAADAAPHRDEHSIEVELPFIQVLAPRAKIVAVVVGTRDPGDTARFGRALAALLKQKRALVVASSDLSHYPSARDAPPIDHRTLDGFAAFDAAALVSREREAETSPTSGLATVACGLGPVMVAMGAARALGATRATAVSYANSADTAVGDEDRVVGYGAVVYHRDVARSALDAFAPATARPPQGPPSVAEKQALLKLARDTFTQFLESDTLPLPRAVPSESMARRQGAFVTLKERGQLRGCIGRIVHDGPLPQLVSLVAFESAFRDSRFPPLTREELGSVDVEISLLSVPHPVASADAIVVGRDGVILRKAGKSAVFLPQVATEQQWTRDEMLDKLCIKAGLAQRCWAERADLSTFQAEVFGERAGR